MNRIILIGNGFDLAHGLPTRYEDFINSYWKGVVESMNGLANLKQVISFRDTYEDDFIKISISDLAADLLRYVLNDLKEEYGSYREIREKLFNRVYEDNWRQCIDMRKELQLAFKNAFFRQITAKSCENWVDIENEYYRMLCECLEKENKNEDRINKELLAVKLHLMQYLQGCEEEFLKAFKVNKEIQKKLLNPVKERDISIKQKHLIREGIPREIMLVNFNYTSIADAYLPEDSHCMVNHIHGKLGEKEDKIIFGYGDELDSKYKALEECNDNRYLENIKSVCYLRSANYRGLLEFAESSYFQVVIMGHSCGNSDRTLLNTLFEHKNCVSIKPFYHQKEDGRDNYDDIVRNIYRNFTNKRLMRDRVVNKTFCEPLPQCR